MGHAGNKNGFHAKKYPFSLAYEKELEGVDIRNKNSSKSRLHGIIRKSMKIEEMQHEKSIFNCIR